MNKIFEQLLEIRGVGKAFLCPKYENLASPEELPDMKKAVKRLISARDEGQKVLIYGDYDVDGVTATTIMKEALEMMGVPEVQTMLPDRFLDGYGMSKRLVERARKEGVNLVVTVDCGSNNPEIISELVDTGTEVIVTDHHELMGEVPKDAVAVVNPKRPEFRKKILAQQAEILEGKKVNDISGLELLSGAGVAFMLTRALVDAGQIKDGQEKWLLDLAMIGTICDAMKLIKDNRIICKFGMLVLKKTRRPGLKELLRVAKVKKLNTDTIGFQIGPRLNAAGRMETAELALKLLTTKSKTEAAKLAEELNKLNAERRAQQERAVSEVEKQGEIKDPVVVVRGEWHEGVVGIISGKLTEKYKKPSFVLTEVDGVLKGSGRSFGEFNLALAIGECRELLASGGGHAAACGLKLKKENFEEFKRKVNSYYMGLGLVNQERFLDVREDLAVEEVGGLNLDLYDEMRQLEPFGEGNPEPVFMLPEVFVLDANRMGAEGQHLRMLVRGDDGKTLKLVAFNAEGEWLELRPGGRVSVWITLVENEWNGVRSVEGRILKLRY